MIPTRSVSRVWERPGKVRLHLHTNHNWSLNNCLNTLKSIEVFISRRDPKATRSPETLFVGNRNQVRRVGTRNLDWSKGGRGNYWSDNPAFDLNGDGIADTAYRPNDLVDRVLWTAPSAKVLINSPAVQVLRWAQAQFPALYPGGVVDSHPLIAPPPRPTGKEVGK